MQRFLLRGKIHRATVTATDMGYEGSLTVDAALLAAADIAPYERVLVADVTNGQRFETYVIPATAGSGAVVVNGAAARLAAPGDVIIVMAFAQVDEREVPLVRPRVVVVGDGNRPLASPVRADP